MKQMLLPAVVFIAVASLGLYGCGRTTKTEPETSNTPSATDGDHMEHGEHDHGDHAHHDDNGQSAMEKMTAELAGLSAEDRAAAEKQHFCPVSGEMLGTMGAPQKIDVNGQQIWICCDGCKDQLLEKPDEYLAKLQKE